MPALAISESELRRLVSIAAAAITEVTAGSPAAAVYQRV